MSMSIEPQHGSVTRFLGVPLNRPTDTFIDIYQGVRPCPWLLPCPCLQTFRVKRAPAKQGRAQRGEREGGFGRALGRDWATFWAIVDAVT